MRQSYQIIPIYTADVSGVCSALYELGGMTVMHDPSGCNSTYNTHDEIRWYDQDSLIFISALTQMDAIMGNDKKFVHDVVQTAKELHPKFIALAGSPIPWLNGTDFTALAKIIEKQTGIVTFHVPTNGMHDYVYGAGLALERVAERLVNRETDSKKSHGINILGMTPLDFGNMQSVSSLRDILTEHGWEVISCWAMGDSLEQLKRAGEAKVNLVVSSVGLRTAKKLQEMFGTPYVVGLPVGAFAGEVLDALKRAEKNGESWVAYSNCHSLLSDDGMWVKNMPESTTNGKSITLIGEPVMMESLAAAIRIKTGRPVQVLCPLEEWKGLLSQNSIPVHGEEEASEQLMKAEVIVADPLYRAICNPQCIFYSLPQVSFSGRIFRKEMVDLLEKELQDW